MFGSSFTLTLSVLQDSIEPVYFYIGVVFALQAVYVTALFICSWVMSGTWVAGMLAVAWFIINRSDWYTQHVNPNSAHPPHFILIQENMSAIIQNLRAVCDLGNVLSDEKLQTGWKPCQVARKMKSASARQDM